MVASLRVASWKKTIVLISVIVGIFGLAKFFSLLVGLSFNGGSSNAYGVLEGHHPDPVSTGDLLLDLLPDADVPKKTETFDKSSNPSARVAKPSTKPPAKPSRSVYCSE
eukprot:1195932-Prorocentrum_minimum.AAC.7